MKVKEINKWLSNHDFSVKIQKGTEFVYKFEDDKIEVANTSWAEMTDYILYCYHLGLKYLPDANVLCLFHEIGHSETLLELSDFICWLDIRLEKLVNLLPDCKLKHWLYYRLPTEKAATKWAINYINSNVREITEFNKLWWQ